MDINLPLIKQQVWRMTDILMNTSSFIVKARLWDGFFRHKLVLLVSIIGVIIIPYSLFEFVRSQISSSQIFNGSNQAIASMNNSISWKSLFEGGNKYVVLILIQMLVVYFSNRTIEYLSGVKIHMTVHELLKSQFRVISVSIRNWVIELIIGIGISIVIGIFGPDWLEDLTKFIIACYFVGYLFIDNYNFTFGMTIKDSAEVVKRHVGAALVVGFVAKVLLLLPIIGSIFVSFICSVGATWYMHTSEDRHAGSEAFVGD